jgi:hypothetical protein
MKSHPELASLQLTDEQRIDHYDQLLRLLVDSLDLDLRKPDAASLQAAAEHGRTRKQQGYSAPMLVEDLRCLRAAINTTIQENLVALDLSELLPDLNRIYDLLQIQLKESIAAFLRVGPLQSRAKTKKGVSRTA